jgi:RNA polymerase sigma factor (sigma-70 family)
MRGSKPPQKLNAKRAKLAADYMPLAKNLAKLRAAKLQFLRDELIGEAILALCIAAATWKPKLCPKFGTWAAYKIQWALLDVLRGELPMGFRSARFSRDSAPATYCVDMGRIEKRRGEALVQPGRVPWQLVGLDQVDAVEAAIARVPAHSRALMRRIYVDGMSVTEAGKAEGLNRCQAMNRHFKALRRLAETLDSTEGHPDCHLEGEDDAGPETV